MTEAGKQWVYTTNLSSLPHDRTEVEWEAEFWLRAFCDEVDKRADVCAKSSPECYHESMAGCRNAAFRELKRELLGG